MEQLLEWWSTSPISYKVIAIVCLVFLLIQLTYDLFLYIRVALWKHQTSPTVAVPVSVVICAKNEERRLRELIPILMEQSHPHFELVVVDDSSWDDTMTTLQTYQLSYKNLHVIHLNEDMQRMRGKKFALTMGLKGAKHDVVLLTDADCMPASNDWIKTMTAPFTNPDTSIVLGVSPYYTSETFLSKLISYDALNVAIAYLSMAIVGSPYMGVGRNLAYRQELFFKNSGFKSHLHLASGDDDLFIKEVANKKNTAIVLEPESQTFSEPKTTWDGWIRQKKRHFTTAPYYRPGTKLILGLWPFSFLALWISCLLWMVLHSEFLIAGSMLLLRYIVHLATFRGSLKKIGQERLAWRGLLLENILWITSPIIWISNLLSKPRTWN